jgi:cell division protein FtsW (lipid II flippase)
MRDQTFAKSQFIWIVICLPMFFTVSLIDYRWVRFGAIPLYVASILGLVATMFIGENVMVRAVGSILGRLTFSLRNWQSWRVS